eukprot:3816282-Amphidinium_carterae.2
MTYPLAGKSPGSVTMVVVGLQCVPQLPREPNSSCNVLQHTPAQARKSLGGVEGKSAGRFPLRMPVGEFILQLHHAQLEVPTLAVCQNLWR